MSHLISFGLVFYRENTRKSSLSKTLCLEVRENQRKDLSLETITLQIYFEAIDFASTAVASRLDEKDLKVYINLQKCLSKATAKEVYDAELAKV